MINVSNEFNEIVNNGGLLFNEATIALDDGTTIELTASDFIASGGFVHSGSVSSTSSFDIGSVIIGQLTIKFHNYDRRYDDVVFDGAEVTAFVCARLSDGTIEKIAKGKYVVVSENFTGGIVTIVAQDKLKDFDTAYTGDRTDVSVLSLANAMALKHGLVLTTQRFNNSSQVISIPDDNDYTDRQVLAYALQITGNYGYIDRYGYMRIEFYDLSALHYASDRINARTFKEPAVDIVDAGLFTELDTEKDIIDAGTFESINKTVNVNTVFSKTLARDDIVITGVKVTDTDENEYAAGEEGYMISIKSNPLVIGNGQEIANNLANVLVGIKFRPMDIKTNCNPLIEAGDIGIVYINGDYYTTIFTNVTYSNGSNTSLVCGAETPSVRASSRNSVVDDAVMKSKTETNKILTAYDVGVQQLTNLMSMSFGVFKTEELQEDGSIIYYMHNRQKLEESDVQWKMTTNTFTVSTDYGKTWNAGFDSQGNAVFNVLNAIGINAEWIKAGTIEGEIIAKQIIMEGGSLDIGDSSGTTHCTITSDGKLKCVDGEFTGNVTALTGTIGGWNIGSDYLQSVSAYGTNRVTFRNTNSSSSGVHIIDVEDLDRSSPYYGNNFFVTSRGFLFAKDANISGTINATSGSIGAWNVEADGTLCSNYIVNNSKISISLNPSARVTDNVFDIRTGEASSTSMEPTFYVETTGYVYLRSLYCLSYADINILHAKSLCINDTRSLTAGILLGSNYIMGNTEGAWTSKEISFGKTLDSVPKVFVQQTGGNSTENLSVQSVTTTGFVIQIYSCRLFVVTFDWIAIG